MVYGEVERYAAGDPTIHLYRDPARVGPREVCAFQTAADVVLQKSLREGFGLTVTEAMWKGKTVIGGRAGGITAQIHDGDNGFLVESPEEAAERVVTLLHDDGLRRAMGQAARETVRQKFLIPRLVSDYVRLLTGEQAFTMGDRVQRESAAA